MKLRIIIVEDETLIRKGIRKKTENLGAEVVFDTDSGYRLFEYIKENGQECFDVLLVDICMPVMNGLDVIAGVKKLKNNVRVVVLSGYSNFDYARQAIRLGVSEYLLKPIEQDALRSVIQRLEADVRKNYMDRMNRAADNLAFHIMGRGDTSLEEDTVKLIRDIFPSGFFVRMYLKGNWRGRYKCFEEEKDGKFCFVYADRPNLLVSLIQEIPADDTAGAGDEANGRMGTHTVFYSGKITDPEAIADCVKRGKRVLKESLILDENIVIFESEQQSEGELKKWDEYFGNRYLLLGESLKEGEAEKIRHHIKRILTYHHVPQTILEKAYLKIIWKICEERGNMQNFPDEEWLQEYDTKEEFIDAAMEAALQLLDAGEEKGGFQENGRISLDQVIDYIEKNYDQDITLVGTAERFYINRSHLARIFKAKTGTTFNNYLTEVRIKNACRLLKEGLTSTETAEQVGYDNSRYFCRVFCKVMGCTPAGYKGGEGYEDDKRLEI